MLRQTIFLLLLAALLLSACAAGGERGAAQAVERYYRAIVEQNAGTLAALTCAEFEEDARTELDSFTGVSAELQDFACQESGAQGEFTLVTCNGKIAATYGNEVLDFPLDDRAHRVRSEGGDWRLCGYSRD